MEQPLINSLFVRPPTFLVRFIVVIPQFSNVHIPLQPRALRSPLDMAVCEQHVGTLTVAVTRPPLHDQTHLTYGCPNVIVVPPIALTVADDDEGARRCHCTLW